MSRPGGPVARECVEGYVYAARPFRILVLRRPPARGRVWVPAGGKVELADADLEAAVRREVLEETGLARPRKVYPLDWHVPFRTPDGARWRLHAYALEVDRPFAPTLSPEHDAFSWLTAEDATGLLHFADNRQAVRRLAALRASPPGSS